MSRWRQGARDGAGGSSLLSFLFEFHVTNPGVAAAFGELGSR
jgi:hypothetical protein